MTGYLSAEDREAIWHDPGLYRIVEQLIRRHRAEVLRDLANRLERQPWDEFDMPEYLRAEAGQIDGGQR